jgi:hypothetical protein
VRSGAIAVSQAVIAAAMTPAVPRYRSETFFGLPSTRAISRQQIRPVLDTGATAMDDIFGNGSHADSHSADLDDDQEEGHNDDDLD